MAVVLAMDNSTSGIVEEQNLRDALSHYNVDIETSGNNFKITVKSNNRKYIVSQDGKVEYYE